LSLPVALNRHRQFAERPLCARSGHLPQVGF
jgi:hypothetical protein